jgi:biopolymer transport protein ExbD
MLFDLPDDHSFSPDTNPKEQMISAIREAEKEMITHTEIQIRELKNQIAEIISTRESYQLGFEAAINAIRSSK